MIKQPLLAHIDSDVQPNQALKCLSLNQSTMFIVKQTHQLISEQQMIKQYMNPVKYYLEIGD
jgi:hypothetical protein